MFFYLFVCFTKSLNQRISSCSMPLFGQATFQLLHSHTWQAAAILDSAALAAISLLSYVLVVHLPGMREDIVLEIPGFIYLVAFIYLGHVILHVFPDSNII